MNSTRYVSSAWHDVNLFKRKYPAVDENRFQLMFAGERTFLVFLWKIRSFWKKSVGRRNWMRSTPRYRPMQCFFGKLSWILEYSMVGTISRWKTEMSTQTGIQNILDPPVTPVLLPTHLNCIDPFSFQEDIHENSTNIAHDHSHGRSHSHTRNSHSHDHSHTRINSSPKRYQPSELDMDKLRSTLKQLVRDWGEEVSLPSVIWTILVNCFTGTTWTRNLLHSNDECTPQALFPRPFTRKVCDTPYSSEKKKKNCLHELFPDATSGYWFPVLVSQD